MYQGAQSQQQTGYQGAQSASPYQGANAPAYQGTYSSGQQPPPSGYQGSTSSGAPSGYPGVDAQPPQCQPSAYGPASGSYGAQPAAAGAYPGTQPGGAGAYGQNAGLASQDYQQQQQQPQQPYPAAAPYGTTSDPSVGQAVVQVPVPEVPSLMIRGGNNGNDEVPVRNYHNFALVAIAICLFVALACIISLISVVDVVNIVFLVLSVMLLFANLFYTRRARLIFEDGPRQIRMVEQRAISHFCQPSTVLVAPYSDLEHAGFTGSPGVTGELYLTVAGAQVGIGQRVYQNQQQIEADVQSWQNYIARKRGRNLADAVANFVAIVAR